MIEKIHALYPIVGIQSEDNDLQLNTNSMNYKEAQVATIKAQETINSYAAFITNGIVNISSVPKYPKFI